jgi:hypothetical protein
MPRQDAAFDMTARPIGRLAQIKGIHLFDFDTLGLKPP